MSKWYPGKFWASYESSVLFVQLQIHLLRCCFEFLSIATLNHWNRSTFCCDFDYWIDYWFFSLLDIFYFFLIEVDLLDHFTWWSLRSQHRLFVPVLLWIIILANKRFWDINSRRIRSVYDLEKKDRKIMMKGLIYVAVMQHMSLRFTSSFSVFWTCNVVLVLYNYVLAIRKMNTN